MCVQNLAIAAIGFVLSKSQQSWVSRLGEVVFLNLSGPFQVDLARLRGPVRLGILPIFLIHPDYGPQNIKGVVAAKVAVLPGFAVIESVELEDQSIGSCQIFVKVR